MSLRYTPIRSPLKICYLEDIGVPVQIWSKLRKVMIPFKTGLAFRPVSSKSHGSTLLRVSPRSNFPPTPIHFAFMDIIGLLLRCNMRNSSHCRYNKSLLIVAFLSPILTNQSARVPPLSKLIGFEKGWEPKNPR